MKSVTRMIFLPRDYVSLVSEEDYEMLDAYTWYVNVKNLHKVPYAYTQWSVGGGKRVTQYMHRMITNCPDGFVVDHKNRNSLDNRRTNLRITTGTFNNVNRGGHTGYRGVSKQSGARGWRARIQFEGVEYHLGTFDSEIDAAKVYDEEAKKLFGEFAWLNFDDRKETETVTIDIPF